MKNLKIFANIIEDSAKDQINNFIESPAAKDTTVRIMPDVHTGAGCVIGFTCRFKDSPTKIIPNIVGVDIGCGMMSKQLIIDDLKIDKSFHDFIEKWIPSGLDVHDSKFYVRGTKNYWRKNEWKDRYEQSKKLIDSLRCRKLLKNIDHLYNSLGSLGGGNHFIEIDSTSTYSQLVVHTGSRNLGKQVAEIYQEKAYNSFVKPTRYKEEIKQIVQELKSQGRQNEIQQRLKELKIKYDSRKIPPRELMWVEGNNLKDYLHDQKICVKWAKMNRQLIIDVLSYYFTSKGFNLGNSVIDSIHNYIDENNIIRKGSCSAYNEELLLIPMNMRDGTIFAKGKGNEDWNYSAPHGAGRLMSRSRAFSEISLEEYQKSMEGIVSYSINSKTIDESPMAYKPVQEIINQIKDTVEIIDTWKPLFNFKASE